MQSFVECKLSLADGTFPISAIDNRWNRRTKVSRNKVDRGITPEEKNLILEMHNGVRSEVARGAATANGVRMLPATTMYKMVRSSLFFG